MATLASVSQGAIERWRQPRGLYAAAIVSAVAGLMVVTAGIVYTTGGTKLAWAHLMYFPILLAAFSFGLPGGVAAGLVGGLLLGPFMPLDVVAGVAQSPEGWLFRVAFFTGIGAAAGQFSDVINRRLDTTRYLLDRVSEVYSRLLQTFGSAVSVHDEMTGQHCQRVAINAHTLATDLQLPADQIEAAYWAGLLHDLGKIAVRREILLKPGKLTPEEYDEVNVHTVVGDRMLRAVSSDFDDIAAGVRGHHERWDGSGYPDGLAGDAIPMIARVLAIVDVYEALTGKRPYRAPLPRTEALDYIVENAGSHFDPVMVEAFARLARRGAIYVWGDQLPRASEPPPRFHERSVLREDRRAGLLY